MRGLNCILLVLVALDTSAQREKFVRYNLALERARWSAHQGDHVSAIATYDSAFALIPFVGSDYFQAVKNALQASNVEKANSLLIKGVENGLPIRQYYDSTVQAFVLSERAMPFLNTWDYMERRYRTHVDTVLINAIEEVGSGHRMVEDPQGGLKREPDSTAFERFMALVELRGFPTLLTAGTAAFRPQWLFAEVLTGYPDDPRWRRVLPHIQRAINAGHLPPDYLCMFQDIEDRAQGRPLTFGTLLWRFDNEDHVVLSSRSAIEKSRAAVGLGPIDHAIAISGLQPEQVTFTNEP